MTYTHEEMVKLCDDAKRMMVTEFEGLISDLGRDVSGQCVWVDEILEGIIEIKLGNGLDA